LEMTLRVLTQNEEAMKIVSDPNAVGKLAAARGKNFRATSTTIRTDGCY
jgi:hypothetical protein